MHVRAFAFTLRLLTLACAGAALGSLTACPYFFDCPTTWTDPESIDFDTSADLIGVGPGTDYASFVAVGLSGLVSTHDGETANAQSPVNVALRAVARREARLLAVGDQGTILISDDAGQTWEPRTSGTTSSLISIVHAQLAGVDFMVAVGVEVIVVSADAGETWTVVGAPATGWGTLRGVFATNARVYAVGDAGVAWSSAAPNGLWNIEVLGTSADLLGGGAHHTGTSVAESETLLVAAADNTVVLRDTSGWHTRELDLDGDILRFSGGYLLTSTGAIYDLDGTGVVSRVPVEFDFTPNAIHADAAGLVVVGDEGRAAHAYFQPCAG
ncbi:WD40/YVTN/BNR-like repeat-containing protein [Nannocystaceae bacterium ST9]